MDIKKIVFKNLDGSLRKVNIVNSINGIDIPDSGAVILDTIKDISADGSSLTVTKSDGSSSKVTLNTSGGVKTVNNVKPDSNGNVTIEVGTVKTVNNVKPDSNGNIEIPVGSVKTVNSVEPDSDGNVVLSFVKSVNGNTPDISGNVTIDAGKVKTVDGKVPDSDGNVALNAIKSINGSTPNASGDFELSTVSDITLSEKNLNIENANGNTKTLVLPFSDVKTVNSVQPDESGNIEIPTGTVKSINNTTPDDNGNVVLSFVKSVNGNTPDISGNVTIDAGKVKTVDGKVPDSDGNVALNAIKSINGSTPNASGDFELSTVSDITLSEKNLNIENANGNTKTLVLPFSDVKTVNSVQPDESGNIEIPTGTVKSINNTTPDDNGNVALNYVQSVFVASGMMAVTSQNGTQQYDLTTQYSSTEESTDGSQIISVNPKTKYHSITLNTSNSSIVFVNPTQSEGTSKSSASEVSTSPATPGVSSSAVIKLELFIKQGTGTNTVTWPANVKWENGIEPVLSLEKDHVDLISLISLDNGQNYYGFAKAVWMN